MIEGDFIMSYPCFILCGGSHGTANVSTIGDDRAILLFTDRDLADKFNEDFCNQKRGRAEFQFLEFADRDELLQFLRQQQPCLAEQDIAHIGIDPTKGKQVMCVEVAELIREIEDS